MRTFIKKNNTEWYKCIIIHFFLVLFFFESPIKIFEGVKLMVNKLEYSTWWKPEFFWLITNQPLNWSYFKVWQCRGTSYNNGISNLGPVYVFTEAFRCWQNRYGSAHWSGPSPPAHHMALSSDHGPRFIRGRRAYNPISSYHLIVNTVFFRRESPVFSAHHLPC